jgi:ribonuclease D
VSAAEPWFVDNEAGLREVVEHLRDEPEYALDTEFHGERTYFPRLALVQIAWRSGLALVDPLAVSLEPLAEILSGPATMVAHAGDQDLAIMTRACGVAPSRLFDTQVAAGFCGLGTPSLVHLADRLLKVELAKGDRLTDWTRRPLSADQRRYAAGDVLHLLPIADRLREMLRADGRLVWAEEECEERRRRDRERPDPRTAWWRIKGNRQLRAKSRGVAQEVAAWRERRAEDSDVPTRHILSDLALAGIIARPPHTRDELAAVRGIDGRALRAPVAEELLGSIRKGEQIDPGDVVMPARDHTDRSLAPALSVIAAWITQRAGEMRLEPALLATRADLAELLNNDDGRLSHGWRCDIVGAPIASMLAGEATIVLREGGRRIELVAHSVEPTVEADSAAE